MPYSGKSSLALVSRWFRIDPTTLCTRSREAAGTHGRPRRDPQVLRVGAFTAGITYGAVKGTFLKVKPPRQLLRAVDLTPVV